MNDEGRFDDVEREKAKLRVDSCEEGKDERVRERVGEREREIEG